MKKLSLFLLLFALPGCVRMQSMLDQKIHGDNPYSKPPFYSRYLSPDNALDVEIKRRIDGLQANPGSAVLHNELGSLLIEKGFPRDAEREFFRAVASDEKFYPAWYNLALLREARGDMGGASRALRNTLRHKPGHAAARFQLGLIAEKRGDIDRAIELYSRAFEINYSLLDVRVNPRILDSKLVDRALLELYPRQHTRQSLQFQGAPVGYVEKTVTEAPSPQPEAADIVTPTPPVTNQATQTPPPTPGAPPAAPAPPPPAPPATPAPLPPGIGAPGYPPRP